MVSCQISQTFRAAYCQRVCEAGFVIQGLYYGAAVGKSGMICHFCRILIVGPAATVLRTPDNFQFIRKYQAVGITLRIFIMKVGKVNYDSCFVSRQSGAIRRSVLYVHVVEQHVTKLYGEILDLGLKPGIALQASPHGSAAEVAEDPAAVVETPEGTTIVVDEATLGEVLSRLDQIISLLQPAAADEDPVEEVAEAVEEALEAVAAAEDPIPVDLSEGIQPEDVAEIVEEILDPVAGEAVSEVLDPLTDECGEEEQEVLSTGDALRTALKAVRPALARMPKKQRARVCADIAARLRKPSGRRGADAGVYAALAAAKRKPPRRDAADLGKRIMATRNINCRRANP